MTSKGAEKMIPSTIGIDISKDSLEVCRLPGGVSTRFDNNSNGHQQLILWLAPTPIARIIFEATGAYHRALEQALSAAG
jgi:transposase